MAADKMIEDAWARFLRLHEDAQRVYANSKQYQQLHNWLSQTFQLFPDSKVGLTEELPSLTPEFIPSELPGVETGATPAPTEMPKMGLGSPIAKESLPQEDLSYSTRRKLSELAATKVESILRRTGRMRLEAIIEEMKLEGWTGYPLDNLKNLYNALQTRARGPQARFKNEGDNYWSLVEGGIFS